MVSGSRGERSIRVKLGQLGQTGLNRVKQGQTGSNRAKQGQTGPNRVKQTNTAVSRICSLVCIIIMKLNVAMCVSVFVQGTSPTGRVEGGLQIR